MVDEQIAKAWGKLTVETPYRQYYVDGGLIPQVTGWHAESGMKCDVKTCQHPERWAVSGNAVPDPGTEPWKWVKAWNAAGWSVLVKPKGTVESPIELRSPEGEWSSHTSLEAAIRAWSASS